MFNNRFILCISAVTCMFVAMAFAQEWQKLPGAGTDIAVGADGSLFVVGTQGDDKGNSIYKFNKADHKWEKLATGSGVNISVGPKGIAWLVNKKSEIFRQKGENWEQLPGTAQDIGIGGDGTAWMTGTEAKDGGGICNKWNEKDWKWTKLTGEGVRIAVSPKGLPWIVNKKNEIYRKKGTTWQKMPGSATDLAIGGDESVWVVGGGGALYMWNEKDFNWVKKEGNGTRIAVGPKGTVFLVNEKNEIYQTK